MKYITFHSTGKTWVMEKKTAGIIIIGDEILKGHIRDANSDYICKRMRALGTLVKKISVIGDSIDEIAETVKEFSSKFNIVLTSGGIGPTHDDVTYKGIAKGFDEEVVRSDSLVAYWNTYFRSEPSQAVSFIPKSAKIIWSKTKCLWLEKGAEIDRFPVVSVSNVFVFPGIPILLQEGFSSIEKLYFQSHGCSFYTARVYLSVDEGLVLEPLNKTVEEMKECVFGSYPAVGDSTGKFSTQITIEADSVFEVQKAEDFFKALIPSNWLVAFGPTMTDNVVYKFLDTTADPQMADTLRKSIKVRLNI